MFDMTCVIYRAKRRLRCHGRLLIKTHTMVAGWWCVKARQAGSSAGPGPLRLAGWPAGGRCVHLPVPFVCQVAPHPVLLAASLRAGRRSPSRKKRSAVTGFTDHGPFCVQLKCQLARRTRSLDRNGLHHRWRCARAVCCSGILV